ncbi:methylesterase 17-like isoform X1 [Chenopodium quinoa]|uniref:methylesterase 17-like isoform X1 n=1 Tax=Chenopodium quinoa TaxID=63459 RepID=UPI000B78DE85|nr:methylesterase 17-like isoform X1 [Chenopodium quinoa]
MTNLPFSVHFVLVHGASHGGWCWYKIRCLLESIGQKVSCPDLSSSGVHPVDANTISTFKEYNKPLDDLLASLPEGEKVILVGHSAGGLSVTNAIQNFPEKIQVGVFVGAVMLQNGFQTEQDRNLGSPDLSKIMDVFDYTHGQGSNNSPSSATFKKEVHREILYQMSPLEDCTLAKMLLRPCPIKALIHGAMFPEGEGSDKVPRVYIKTLHDKVYSREQQDVMIKRWPPSNVYEIDSDHCPMFSNPSHLFGLLLKVATNFESH